jgi:hypothetical protein
VGRKFILWVLSYAWIALLAGLGLLAMAGYTVYSAGHGGKIPLEADLTVASGHIVEGREMTVERKRRRGGRSTSKHYELDLKPASGEILKLKIDHAVPRDALADAVDEDVTVKYDPNDDNNTYVIQRDGQDLVPYAAMAQLSQKRANEDKATFTSGGMMGFAALLALLGAAGVWWRRRLLAVASTQVAASVPGASIGADLPPHPAEPSARH